MTDCVGRTVVASQIPNKDDVTLIAAAPELLEVAKLALSVLLKVEDGAYSDAVKRASVATNGNWGVCDELANIISKAEGRSE